MIVPVSIASTDGFIPLRQLLTKELGTQWFSSYSIRPSKLFEGAEKRLTIVLGTRKHDTSNTFVSHFYSWFSEERGNLFSLIRYVLVEDSSLLLISIPKIQSRTFCSILSKCFSDREMRNAFRPGGHEIFYSRKFRYFTQVLSQSPKVIEEDGTLRAPSETKILSLGNEIERFSALSVYLSSLFLAFVFIYSDCRHLNQREVALFPCDFSKFSGEELAQLAELGKQVDNNLQENSYIKENNFKKFGKLKIQFFQPRLSKPIIDEIDALLAKHYGFTEEELDFIVNYDIKYRMGDELAGGND